jgi:hypothetical protein
MGEKGSNFFKRTMSDLKGAFLTCDGWQSETASGLFGLSLKSGENRSQGVTIKAAEQAITNEFVAGDRSTQVWRAEMMVTPRGKRPMRNSQTMVGGSSLFFRHALFVSSQQWRCSW